MSDLSKIINPSQLGGIESYVLNDGDGRGVRALCVNTGADLRYRVLVDRGMDIDQAFFNQHSLTFLTHRGVTAPSRSLDRGIDWLKGFAGGLLTSCGPTNIGPPTTDQGEELGLHGTHSNTAATIESLIQPDPRRGRNEMRMVALMRYGRLFGPNLELRRTIVSRLGENVIEFTDEFYNAGNTPTPHAWLLHINFGYPLLDEGALFCYDAQKIEPRNDPKSLAGFAEGQNYKRMAGAPAEGAPVGEIVAYLYPRPDRDAQAVVGIVNRALGLGVSIRYSTKEFPRCGNWQYASRHEYVAALEPMNGTVDGRDKDRQRGLMDTLAPGQSKTYRYSISVLTNEADLSALEALNAKP
jgi:hypothetical protein